jgi:hypothetical protein
MLTLKNIIIGLSNWLWWLVACITGLFLGLTLSLLIFSLLKSIFSGPSPQLYTYITFPCVGLTLGFSQWFLIRRYLPRARSWILANGFSYSLNMILWVSLQPFIGTVPDYRGTSNLILVAVASILLWLIIRPRFTRSLGWALVSGMGLFVFFYAIQLVGYDLGQSSGLYIVGDFLTFAFSIGIPSGVVSGFLMTLLLGPVLSRDSTLVEGLERLSEVSKFSTRPEIRDVEASPPEPNFVMFLLVKIGLPLLIIGMLVLVLMISGPSYPQAYESTGLEITPEEFAAARTLWVERPFSHYRLVARYHHNIDYCYEDVEILEEKVVHVYEQDCEAIGLKSVTDIFELFDRFVGNAEIRPPVGNGCSYYYVDAIFDDQFGYPIYMETHDIIEVSKRKTYVSHAAGFACLLFLPIQYTVEIESLTPLP